MTRISDVYQAIDAIAPFSSQCSWDNSGLLVGDAGGEVRRILVALDATLPVIRQAAAQGAQLVVSHHPVVFHPVKRFLAGDPAFEAAAAGVAVLSAHTNYDMAPCGVNFALARLLGLGNLRPLAVEREEYYRKIVVFVPPSHGEAVYHAMAAAGAGALGNYTGCAGLYQGLGRFLPTPGADPFLGRVGRLEETPELRIEMICPPQKEEAVLAAMRSAHPYEEPAYDVLEDRAIAQKTTLGLVGELGAPLFPQELAALVEKKLGLAPRFLPGWPAEKLSRVAVCGGAGAEYWQQAAALGCRALVTGDVRHHEFLAAQAGGVLLMDAGHYATENPAMSQLAAQLRTALPAVAVDLAD